MAMFQNGKANITGLMGTIIRLRRIRYSCTGTSSTLESKESLRRSYVELTHHVCSRPCKLDQIAD